MSCMTGIWMIVKIILEYKKDIWKNDKLFNIVEEYFGSSLQTPDFCTALEKCFKGARESQIALHIALRRFEEEGTNEESSRGEYVKILDELMHFKDVGNSFTKEYLNMFQSVYKQQVSMLEKLKKKKKKLDKNSD
ncbi:uncharacterized protein A4U43_C08F11730 [Asparagus officinalis]|nr:uncharacterized protein A4U43_C08F11730 [Asparagus officinalis]